MKKKKKPSLKRTKRDKIISVLLGLLLVLVIILITIYIGYRVASAKTPIFTLRFFAIIAGLIYESLRVTAKPKKVWYILIGSFFLSYFALLPGKHETNYSFTEHLYFMPYAMVIMFMVIMCFMYFDEIKLQLNEGIVLLLHSAFVYYCYENGILNFNSFTHTFSTVLISLISLFILLHAFTKIQLTDGVRFIFSIWISITLMILAITNIYHVLNIGEIEQLPDFNDKVLVFLNNFLLGVSAIYIVENLIMIFRFLPEKGSISTGKYKLALRESKEAHINRFALHQLSPLLALLLLLLLGSWFTINHIHQYLPVNLAIWSAVVLAPMVMYFLEKLFRLNRRRM